MSCPFHWTLYIVRPSNHGFLLPLLYLQPFLLGEKYQTHKARLNYMHYILLYFELELEQVHDSEKSQLNENLSRVTSLCTCFTSTYSIQCNMKILIRRLVWFMVFNDIFNNISVISWRSVLLVENTGGTGENHRPATSRWQTISHNVVHLGLSGIRTHNISGERHR